MSSPQRNKSASPDPSRPKIWVEGRQQPPFDPRAWARVSLLLTRRALAPVLSRAATATDAFGQRVRSGALRPNLAWLGRAARFVPSHLTVGSLIIGTAALIATARETVDPTPVAAPAYPNLIRPDFAPRTALPRLGDPVEPTLARVRALFDAAPDPLTVDETAKTPGLLHHAAAASLGWSLILLALPFGAFQATLTHLTGTDLRDVD